MLRSSALKALIALVTVVAGLLFAGPAVQARETASSDIALTALPKEGQQVYALILQGGPFKYEKDGVVFGNRERQLPAQKRGFYREYTVKTPASRDRGALRIVCGGQMPTKPEACYYTADHYASFKKIIP